MEKTSNKYEDIFCAYLDVLGYKSVETSVTRIEIRNILRDKITEAFNTHKSMLDGAKKFGVDIDPALIQMKVIQDGILIYTTDSSTKSFDTIVLKCVNFLAFFNIPSVSIPIRGVITRGDLYFDDSPENFVIRGSDEKELPEVFELSEALDWMGVALTLKVVLTMHDRVMKLVERLLIVGEVKDHPNRNLNYTLPIKPEFEQHFKAGSIRSAYALNWQWFFNATRANLNWWSQMLIPIPSNSSVELKKENMPDF